MTTVNFNKSVPIKVTPTTSAADTLKEIMDYYQITQTDFAAHIAISQKQLSFILNRRAFMSVDVARRIEQATGMSAKWLLQLDLNYRLTHHPATPNTDVRRFAWATNA